MLSQTELLFQEIIPGLQLCYLGFQFLNALVLLIEVSSSAPILPRYVLNSLYLFRLLGDRWVFFMITGYKGLAGMVTVSQAGMSLILHQG